MSLLYDRCKSVLPFDVSSAVVVDGSNVASYFWLNTDVAWKRDSEIPNLAPPWPLTWVDVKHPRLVSYNGQLIPWREFSDLDSYAVVIRDVTDENELGMYRQEQEISNDMRRKLGEQTCTKKPKWAITIDCVADCGTDIVWPYSRSMLVFSDGSCMSTSHAVPSKYGTQFMAYQRQAGLPADMDSIAKEISAIWTQIMLSGMLTVSFLHCKNVSISKSEYPPQLQKKHLKKHGRPLVSYYTLDINPMKQVLRTEGGMGSGNSLQKALHICRGHFATYTPEKPLFGRHTGTFWVPQHVRGNADNGINVKDYRVKVDA